MTRPRQLWLAVDWQDPAPALRTVSAFVHSVRAVDPVELTLASETLGEHDASTRLIALMREDVDLAARWDRLPGILVHEGAVPGSVPPEDRLDAGSTSAERSLHALRDELAPYVSVTPVRDRVDWARAWRPEPGFRAIAADNGSTDGTAEALRDAGAHVVTGEKPLGRVASWRAAMEAFRDGTDRPWMKWLFAGDELDPGAADALDAALAAHPEAKLIVGAYYIRHPNGETRLWRTLPETRMVEPVESLLISTQHNWFGGPIGQALHRDVLDEVDFGAQPWVADWQSFLSVARTHPVLYVAEPMGVFDMTHRRYFLQHSQRVGSLVQELSLRMQSLDALKEIAHGPQLDQLEQELHVRAAQELGERVASQVARSTPSRAPAPAGPLGGRRVAGARAAGLVGVLERLRPFQDALELVHEPAALDDHDKSRKLRDKAFPYSCTDEEGLVMFDVIASSRLRSGFEVATAFGYSSAFLGLALERTGGRLVTMDCYVEEWKESFNYEGPELVRAVAEVRDRIAQGEPPSGLALATGQLRALGLEDVVTLAVGISPEGVPEALGDRTLDFALIDGGHFGDQPRLDFEAVAPRLQQRCAVFFHDNNDNAAVARAIAAAEERLGTPARVLPTRYNLTLVGRDLEPGTLAALDEIILRAARRG